MFYTRFCQKISQIFFKLLKNCGLKKSKNVAGDKKSKQEFEKIIFNLNPAIPKLLYLHHEWGGGVDFWLQNKVDQLRSDNYIFILFYQKKLKKINLQIIFKEQISYILLNNFEEIKALFDKLKIDIIYINQISFFPNTDAVFNFIKHKKQDDSRVVMLMHDFSSICVKLHLIKDDGSKCDIIGGNKMSCNCSPNAAENIKKWKPFLINQVDEIICFSKHSMQVISQFYPEISGKIINLPHNVPFLRKVNVNKKHPTINIATIGFLNQIKGCDIVEKMSQIIIDNNLPVRIFSIGKSRVKSNLALKILGKYHREDLPNIIEDNEIDIVFISSICPETFSYTTHEAMLMGVKLACFDIGAQAEYTKKYDQGLIISQVDAKTALDEILNFVKLPAN